MYVCKNCGHKYSSYVNFCGRCNGEVEKLESQASKPPADYVNAPVEYNTRKINVVPTGAKVKGFIGMGVGIEGLICSCLSVIYAFVLMALAGEVGSDEEFILIPFAMVVFILSAIGMASGIVAFCLSGSSRNSGFISKSTGVGRIFGIVSMAVCGLSFFLIFISSAVAL